ncbi:diguanylate cyclase [Leifsonia sp. Leaf264]|uniref:diguanylate cyclase n=1 Tax=Leifsonia sp. Leaf264 TaxID=1736314 RepID=UPI0006FE1187|nr:diguanylate cyclase [Leifsonia sp. Leaf264]KQP01778.1 hypothetical protein ASF30_04180 [Leifsonia sp. Leaf264]
MTEPESSYRELYEHAPCGHLTLTSDGVIVRANSTFLDWTGYTSTELVGRLFAELLTRGGQIFAETRYLPLLRLEGAVNEVALSMRRADGSTLPTLVNSVLAEQADGQPGLIHLAVFDATARQNYERELLTARRQAEASEERVRVLQHASSAFMTSTTENAVAEAVVDSMRHGFAAASVAVLLIDESGDLVLTAGEIPGRPVGDAPDGDAPDGDAPDGHPLDGDTPGGDAPDDVAQSRPEGPEHEAIHSGEVVVLADRRALRERYPALGEEFRAGRVEALTAVPLSFDGTASGVVLCFFGRARTFDSDAIEVQEAVARQASEALVRVRLQRRLERMALFDQLTGLANRQLLKVRLEEALGTAERTRHSTALIFLDLDGFKTVNDQLGHVVGDAVLREVAGRLRATIRPSDVAGRFGGDEFIIICEDADTDAASAIADRLRAVVGAPMSIVPDEYAISASVGVAVYSPGVSPSVTPDRLFTLADTAMYRSKNAGKDRTTAIVFS